ncbi:MULTISPECIES: hypothetical protein [Pandoraea]|uniref:hypothetical protein n=1 Tax=Pandoraea TaxID=93217 RepID=UPI001F5DF370|nr:MULTISPECIES: hypothetical protein [Pandoraea]MCI3204926.1 hypothetical protein [Pandoraea sp. LA3]MDN4582954.1 hypothetical protein [Pandoraea capi]
MIYRHQGQASRMYFDAPGVSGTASLPSAASRSDDPLLSTIAVADGRLSDLQTQANAWLANAQARMAVAREAGAYVASVAAMEKRVSAGGSPQQLPQPLRDFAVRHGLVASHAAEASFDAAGLQSLGAKLQSLAANDGASSTSAQIELKRLVTRYDNTLTLYNAVVSKLGEIMKRLVSSI